MRSWKKRWKDELDAVISPLSDTVKNTPIPVSEEVKTEEDRGKFHFKEWILAHRNRVFGGVATALASVVALCIILPNVFLNPSNGDGGGDVPPVPTPVSMPTAVLLEINPRVVFSVDADGEISAVVAMDADADVILSDETRMAQMQGKTLKEGVQVFVDYAARLGYLDFEMGSAVRLSGEDQTTVESASTELETYFRAKGAYTAVVRETLALDEFCERAGLENAQDMGALTQELEKKPSLYSEREAEGKSEEELKTLYSQFVPSQELLALIALIELFDPSVAAQLRTLLELPQTYEDYLKKLDEYFKHSYDELEEKNAEGYGQVRDELTKGAYDAYIKGIEETYGSLAAYWAAQNAE